MLTQSGIGPVGSGLRIVANSSRLTNLSVRSPELPSGPLGRSRILAKFARLTNPTRLTAPNETHR
jgi:hypothetical protein